MDETTVSVISLMSTIEGPKNRLKKKSENIRNQYSNQPESVK